MKKELTRETVLETLGVLSLACLVVGHLLRHRPLAGRGFLAAATLLLALGLFVRPAAHAIARTWLSFGEVVGARQLAAPARRDLLPLPDADRAARAPVPRGLPAPEAARGLRPQLLAGAGPRLHRGGHREALVTGRSR